MSAGVRFLIGFALGVAGLIVAFGAAFAALDAAGRLKAPAFTNRITFDEKMRYFRQHPIENPQVLFIGSSTTLHGLDGDILRQVLGIEGEVANIGVQDLRVNQSRYLGEFFLEYYGTVNQAIMISTTLDYKDCTEAKTEFFDSGHVRDYLTGGSELFYHFKYLDLQGVFRRAGSIKELRSTHEDLESVTFDPHGSLLLEVPRDKINPRVWRGDPITLDPACYEQLRGLANDLKAAGIAFTFVLAPMRPGYLDLRDLDGSLLARHRALLAEHLRATGALVIDAHAALVMPDEAFFDAYHLNRDQARAFTRFVGERMLAASQRPAPEEDVGPSAAIAPKAPRQPSPDGG